ncbi:hypothetical protein APHAL10511_006828 [Amanita phalloides]|nr:hypothetical protein APHAL10511_006828 [Amanita phalloides]
MPKLGLTIFFFLATLSSIVLASPIQRRDIGSLEQCLRQLSTDSSKLASAVNGVGDTFTYPQALAINTQVNVVKGDLSQCYKDVDVQAILDIFEGLAPIIVGTLNSMVKKKNVFKRLPFAVQIILPQLKALYGGSTNLETALNTLTPPNDKQEAMRIENEINAAFQNAINAYSQ